MPNPISWPGEGKIAKLVALFSAVSLLFAAALASELPARADESISTDDTMAEDSYAPAEGRASWYVHPRYRNELMAASTVLPKGSKARVTNLANNKSVIVTIKDYGPDPAKHPDRVIDLNKIAFQKIASARIGIINVLVEPIYIATSTGSVMTASAAPIWQ